MGPLQDPRLFWHAVLQRSLRKALCKTHDGQCHRNNQKRALCRTHGGFGQPFCAKIVFHRQLENLCVLPSAMRFPTACNGELQETTQGFLGKFVGMVSKLKGAARDVSKLPKEGREGGINVEGCSLDGKGCGNRAKVSIRKHLMETCCGKDLPLRKNGRRRHARAWGSASGNRTQATSTSRIARPTAFRKPVSAQMRQSSVESSLRTSTPARDLPVALRCAQDVAVLPRNISTRRTCGGAVARVEA